MPPRSHPRRPPTPNQQGVAAVHRPADLILDRQAWEDIRHIIDDNPLRGPVLEASPFGASYVTVPADRTAVLPLPFAVPPQRHVGLSMGCRVQRSDPQDVRSVRGRTASAVIYDDPVNLIALSTVDTPADPRAIAPVSERRDFGTPRRVSVPEFELSANPTVRLADVRQRRFSFTDRGVQGPHALNVPSSALNRAWAILDAFVTGKLAAR